MLAMTKKFMIQALAVLALTAPLVEAAEQKEYAYKETLLCSDVAPEDAALFERYFGSSTAPVADGWDSKNLVSYHSSWCRNRAGQRILAEWITVYSEDGSTLRELRCERFKETPEIRRNYLVQESRAVVPFVFISNLVRIVDFDDETLYARVYRRNPETRRNAEVEKQWTRKALYAMQREVTEEEKSLFDTYFPRHKRRHTPPTWDAGRRVLYSARGLAGAGGAYALNGCLKHIAPDGSSCRIAVKTLETKGAWKCLDRPWARELPMVVPFVFVELSDKLRFHIEQFNPRTGAYEGTRIREYDFRSLELVNDTWTPAAPSN